VKLVSKGEKHIVVDSFLSDLPLASLALATCFVQPLDIAFCAGEELLARANGGKREEGVDTEEEVDVRRAVGRKVNVGNVSDGRDTIPLMVDVDRRPESRTRE
jgi:hypothetical protein